MFFTHFVISFIVSSFTILVIMLIKNLFQKQLSAKWQYNLWFLLFIALILPFIPSHLFSFGNHFFHLFSINQSNGISSSTMTTNGFGNVNWLQDFSISVARSSSGFLNIVLIATWLAGGIVMTVLTVHAWIKVNNIKSTTSNLKNKEILLLFEQCKQDLNISRHLIVGESPLVKSPMTFGLLRTYVVFPAYFDDWLSMKDIKYIILHELIHIKYKDIVSNYLIVIYQIIYWFNPIIWLAFREMRIDREIACDMAVLHSLDEHCYAEYGSTIINFLDRALKLKNFALTNQFNGPKQQIKKRIERIAAFRTDSKLLQLKSIAIFMLVGIVVASQVPLVSVMADDNNRYDFTSDRTVLEDLSDYFSGYKGSFVLYDLKADQYCIYDENKSKLRISPDSTYKIYLALVGLDSNVITRENSSIPWNGTQYPFDSWNKDQNLITAMQNSVSWYFQDLDKRIQQDKIQAYLNKIGYGNDNISGGIGQYWLESSLKISPVEQVQLLKAFYTNQFGFKEKDVRTVQDSIKLEEKDGALLSGKTGTGTVNNKNINGWFIGYVETKDDTYFFATNIQNEDNAKGSKAAEITLSILKDKGIYVGG
jgi:bla regulator protein BlaR1